MQREEINWQSAFSSLRDITGLPLVFQRGKWYGKCYINGDAHGRWDKTVARLTERGIQLIEQGGERISLPAWLIRYGGCKEWRDAYDVIRTGTGRYIPEREARIWTEPPLKYVSEGEWGKRDGECALRRFLSERFGSERVSEVWDMYGVGSKKLRDGSVATVFWYRSEEGRVCHDKVMLYGSDGKRDRAYGGGRKYKVGDGYRGRCYFGSHLLSSGKQTCVVESEKSAIGLKLIYPECNWIATGGATQLRMIESDWILFPDYDDIGLSWGVKYPNNVKKWYLIDGVKNGNDFFDVKIRNYEI